MEITPGRHLREGRQVCLGRLSKPPRALGSDPVIGKRRWAIAEGYIPEGSHGPEPEMVSHETVCPLDAGDRDASVELTIPFPDREPVGPDEATVPADRTRHLRFDERDDPEPVPRATPFASVVEADHPVVVQHTRLDSRQAENALSSTVAHPVTDG